MISIISPKRPLLAKTSATKSAKGAFHQGCLQPSHGDLHVPSFDPRDHGGVGPPYGDDAMLWEQLFDALVDFCRSPMASQWPSVPTSSVVSFQTSSERFHGGLLFVDVQGRVDPNVVSEQALFAQ